MRDLPVACPLPPGAPSARQPVRLTAATDVTARLLALAAVLWSAACSTDPSLNIRRYQLTATVVSAEAAPHRVRLAHDAVPGLMPAMTMDLGIKGEGRSRCA